MIEIKNKILNYIKNNFILIVAFLVIYFIGTVIGVICASLQDTNTKLYLKEQIIFAQKNMITLDFFQSFIANLLIKGKILFGIWLAGLILIGVPVIFLLTLFSGFLTGFVTTFLFSLNTIKSLLFCLIYATLKFTFYIPAVLILAIGALRVASYIWSSAHNKESKLFSDILKSYFVSGIIGLILISMQILVEFSIGGVYLLLITG